MSSLVRAGVPFRIHWKRDVYGNSVAVATFLQAAKELTIASEVVVEHYEEQLLDFALEDYAQFFPFDYDPDGAFESLAYRRYGRPERCARGDGIRALDCS